MDGRSRRADEELTWCSEGFISQSWSLKDADRERERGSFGVFCLAFEMYQCLRCVHLSPQSSSVSPSASFRTGEKHRSSTDLSSDNKKQRTEDKELASTRYVREDEWESFFLFVMSAFQP